MLCLISQSNDTAKVTYNNIIIPVTPDSEHIQTPVKIILGFKIFSEGQTTAALLNGTENRPIKCSVHY
jgi:hypothetical protein